MNTDQVMTAASNGFGLSWFDWILVALIALSTAMSLGRGFVREALSLGTWVAAFVVARLFYAEMDALLASIITDALIRGIAAFAALFIGTLLVGALIAFLLGALINATGLSSTDRVLGMVFGLARGSVIATVSIGLLSLTPLVNDAWYQRSMLAPYFETVADWGLSEIQARLDRQPRQ